MLSAFSSSYSTLNNPESEENEGLSKDVYQTTTLPCGDTIVIKTPQKFNVLSSLGKVFRRSTGPGRGVKSSQSVTALPHDNLKSSVTVTSLPATATPQQLTPGNYNRLKQPRCKSSESMDEQLMNVQLSYPRARTLCCGQGLVKEERIETKFGTILVGIQGDRSKPAIVTYHDLGLNYISNFQAFFNFMDMKLLLQNFCVYHVNAPGQEEGAATLVESFIFPTMDELAEQVFEIVLHYGLKRIIGFGVGAGANILCRFALAHPDKIDGLCVLNCLSTQTGWIEWAYQKMNSRNLRRTGSMTQGVLDYLMWHHFGNLGDMRNHDLTHVYRQYFETQVNPTNLGLFIDSYIKRTDLDITRELDPLKKVNVRTIRTAVLNIIGALSPHVDDTVTFNGRLDPVNSTWMKIEDCGMVLEEQPAKLCEAFRLFLQGQGYAIKLLRKDSSPESKSF